MALDAAEVEQGAPRRPLLYEPGPDGRVVRAEPTAEGASYVPAYRRTDVKGATYPIAARGDWLARI